MSPSLNFFPLRSHKNKGQADETKRIEAEGRNSQFISQEKKKKNTFCRWYIHVMVILTLSRRYFVIPSNVKSHQIRETLPLFSE
jgi:hypothetical protein